MKAARQLHDRYGGALRARWSFGGARRLVGLSQHACSSVSRRPAKIPRPHSVASKSHQRVPPTRPRRVSVLLLAQCRLAERRRLLDFDERGSSALTHNAANLSSPRICRLQERGSLPSDLLDPSSGHKLLV